MDEVTLVKRGKVETIFLMDALKDSCVDTAVKNNQIISNLIMRGILSVEYTQHGRACLSL